MRKLCVLLPFFLFLSACNNQNNADLQLNELGYFEKPGLNVMVFSDFYPEGHQGGVSIILNGVRVASNGDVRLEATPGQWQPIPKMLGRKIDTLEQIITASLVYPDSSRDRKGFNPIIYPEGLYFTYEVEVIPEGDYFRILVNLDEPIPEEWVGKIGFNFELFPGEYFGKHYLADGRPGVFPRQLNGPMYRDESEKSQAAPLAEGRSLVISPDDPSTMMTIETEENSLKLYDGRAQHNNGWFIVRSEIPAGKTKGAVQWLVKPNAQDDFLVKPVVHTSQVGYHPSQQKVAVIEMDKYDDEGGEAILQKIEAGGKTRTMDIGNIQEWGEFLRYRYLKFDFSELKEPGLYRVKYRDRESSAFEVRTDIYSRHVWQPTLEYFLPVQMCHMRVNDRYRVWHGLCHMDDALMAPVNHNHFDGYSQGSSTLTSFRPGQHVPGLNTGGWHDAGDYDLRVESQMGTVSMLSEAWLRFGVDYDVTTIDQEQNLVELHQPDGIPDILQQIEHGVLTVLGGYHNLGRLYRGIICNDLRQYVLLGDGSTMTDNKVYKEKTGKSDSQRNAVFGNVPDDRWVFTEENPARELDVAAGLATASRALREYKPEMADECIRVATVLYENNREVENKRARNEKVSALAQLYLATEKEEYIQELINMQGYISDRFQYLGPAVAPVISYVKDKKFLEALEEAAKQYRQNIDELEKANPFGVPYEPKIWGAGWEIQRFGVSQYFLHDGWPEIFDMQYPLQALNFVLGCHPGDHSRSFASGVGATSLETAYGTNRAEWSYIPGGVGSGTALIRPDFPELKEWPYFWQQTEYVMGGGGSNFMFLVLAAENSLTR